MEISNNLNRLDLYQAQLKKSEALKPGAQQTQANAQAGGKGDTVTLSPEAMLRTSIHTAAQNAPDVRQEKVNAIKQDVANGTYKVDSRKIAAKMLKENAEVFGAR